MEREERERRRAEKAKEKEAAKRWVGSSTTRCGFTALPHEGVPRGCAEKACRCVLHCMCMDLGPSNRETHRLDAVGAGRYPLTDLELH